MPEKFVRAQGRQEFSAEDLWSMVPEGHVRFAGELCDRYGVPPLREGVELARHLGAGVGRSRWHAGSSR